MKSNSQKQRERKNEREIEIEIEIEIDTEERNTSVSDISEVEDLWPLPDNPLFSSGTTSVERFS